MRNHCKFLVVLGFFLAVHSCYLFAQVGINTSNSPPDASAMLDVNSTTKGALLPRMTFDQRNAISGPAEGLMVFCTNCNTNGALSIYSNGAWRSFTPCNTPTSSVAAIVVSPGQIIWNWTPVPGATGYKWNTIENYGTALDMLSATSKTETGILCGATCNRYVWAINECGISMAALLVYSVPATPPVPPSAGSHTATLSSIVWNWNTAADAIGYKWNTTNDYASAIEMGTVTTKSESGLTCGNSYTRFVWAYNGCGYSTSLSLVQSTIACWVCSDPFTTNHIASGGVAPVDKTVTYGTVNNIPGELTKCWITQNLGAAQQATVVSDATEAPAGWYFQFNRKQGYQYLSSRIPATTWISSIIESSDWIAVNDPCTIELGTGWRLPTSTEWANVDASGNWNNWNGPYGSALKIHAAGYLFLGDGSVSYRGTYGLYWSSTQNDATYGRMLTFISSSSNVEFNNKAYGFSARCVRDY